MNKILISLILFLLSTNTIYADTEINGGKDAPRQKYITWIMTDTGYCTGVLLSERVVMFSRHCYNRGHVMVVLGEHDMTIEDNELILSSTTVITHLTTLDLSLIILPVNVRFNDKIQPIEIADTISTNKLFTLYGWGLTEEFENPEKLQMTNQVFSSLSHNLCVRDPINQSSAYPGDSGGPIIQDNKVTGVISFIAIINSKEWFTCGVNLLPYKKVIDEYVQQVPVLFPVTTTYVPWMAK